MPKSDPKELSLHLDGGDVSPIANDGLLHPLEIHSVVDVTHMIDIGCRDRNRVMKCRWRHDDKMGSQQGLFNIEKLVGVFVSLRLTDTKPQKRCEAKLVTIDPCSIVKDTAFRHEGGYSKQLSRHTSKWIAAASEKSLRSHEPTLQIRMTFEQVLLFLPAAAIVAASPNANNLLAFANGSRHGLLPVIAQFGRCLAFAFMIATVIAGLGARLDASETAFHVIKWAGVVYLVYLGVTGVAGLSARIKRIGSSVIGVKPPSYNVILNEETNTLTTAKPIGVALCFNERKKLNARSFCHKGSSF